MWQGAHDLWLKASTMLLSQYKRHCSDCKFSQGLFKGFFKGVWLSVKTVLAMFAQILRACRRVLQGFQKRFYELQCASCRFGKLSLLPNSHSCCRVARLCFGLKA